MFLSPNQFQFAVLSAGLDVKFAWSKREPDESARIEKTPILAARFTHSLDDCSQSREQARQDHSASLARGRAALVRRL